VVLQRERADALAGRREDCVEHCGCGDADRRVDRVCAKPRSLPHHEDRAAVGFRKSCSPGQLSTWKRSISALAPHDDDPQRGNPSASGQKACGHFRRARAPCSSARSTIRQFPSPRRHLKPGTKDLDPAVEQDWPHDLRTRTSSALCRSAQKRAEVAHMNGRVGPPVTSVTAAER
jgi:hypothetical protein